MIMEKFNIGDIVVDDGGEAIPEKGVVVAIGKCWDIISDPAHEKYKIVNSQLGGIDCIAVEYKQCPERLYIFPKSYPTVTKQIQH